MSEADGSRLSFLKRLAPMIYGPTILFALGEGAVVPLLPVLAQKLGANIAIASLVAAALVIGELCGNLPAGWAVAKYGERRTMIVSGTIAIGGVVLLAFASNMYMLTGAALIIGFCAAAFALARHAFMTTRVPLSFRARALALLGGSFRLGMFVGPFAAAALLGIFLDEHASIWFQGICMLAAVLLVALGPDPERVAPPIAPPSARDTVDTGEPITGGIPVVGDAPHAGVFATMRQHRNVLLRLGTAAAALSATRSARQAILPLWGVSIGLDAQTIALVVGLSGAVDFALFYASGQIMDRYGRLWAVLPAMLLMGSGFLALALTHDLSSASMWFAAFGIVLGVGNGLSSGILMTLGSDLAPPHDPAPFLGSWRTLNDAGGAIAPVLVSAITAALSLAWATGAMGLLALIGAAGFARWIPRYIPKPTSQDG